MEFYEKWPLRLNGNVFGTEYAVICRSQFPFAQQFFYQFIE